MITFRYISPSKHLELRSVYLNYQAKKMEDICWLNYVFGPTALTKTLEEGRQVPGGGRHKAAYARWSEVHGDQLWTWQARRRFPCFSYQQQIILERVIGQWMHTAGRPSLHTTSLAQTASWTVVGMMFWHYIIGIDSMEKKAAVSTQSLMAFYEGFTGESGYGNI